MATIQEFIERIKATAVASAGPIVVALDGRSGAGKSTLAAKVAASITATVIEGDDFYSGGRGEEWDAMNPAERALYCIDWRRLRPILRRLREGKSANWYPFDWAAFDGRLELEPRRAPPSDVTLLEGVYSARPELADLVDLTVQLDTPQADRQRQLDQRESHTLRRDWSHRWDDAETYYFSNVMPRQKFDLIVSDIGR